MSFFLIWLDEKNWDHPVYVIQFAIFLQPLGRKLKFPTSEYVEMFWVSFPSVFVIEDKICSHLAAPNVSRQWQSVKLKKLGISPYQFESIQENPMIYFSSILYYFFLVLSSAKVLATPDYVKNVIRLLFRGDLISIIMRAQHKLSRETRAKETRVFGRPSARRFQRILKVHSHVANTISRLTDRKNKIFLTSTMAEVETSQNDFMLCVPLLKRNAWVESKPPDEYQIYRWV